MNRKNLVSAQNQQGAALVISLLLLLIVTIIAVSMSQTTTLEERMAGNARDTEAAFQAAEAGLRAGEQSVWADDKTLAPCNDLTACRATPQDYFSAIDLSDQDNSWWSTNGVKYGTSGGHDLTEVQSDPHYVVTVRGVVKDTSTIGRASSGSGKIYYYEITSRSHGKTDSSEAVVQSIYARR